MFINLTKLNQFNQGPTRSMGTYMGVCFVAVEKRAQQYLTYLILIGTLQSKKSLHPLRKKKLQAKIMLCNCFIYWNLFGSIPSLSKLSWNNVAISTAVTFLKSSYKGVTLQKTSLKSSACFTYSIVTTSSFYAILLVLFIHTNGLICTMQRLFFCIFLQKMWFRCKII